MSSLSDNSLEQRLQEIMQFTLGKYQQMNQMADQMLNSNWSPEQWSVQADQLRKSSLEMEQLDLNTRELKQQYRASRTNASPEVAQLNEQVASQMQSFLMKISCLEQRTLKSKQALMPQIHDGVKAVQMKNAYGKYG